MRNKYQYDYEYYIAIEDNFFPHDLDYEEEEAFSRVICYGRK